MTKQEAQQLLEDDNAEYPAVVEAVAWLCDQPRTSRHDLLRCLDRGGLAAEMAAMRLHETTGRPLLNAGQTVILARADWEQFFAPKRGIHA